MTLPPVPDSFYWTTESWGAALRCRPLEAVAPHLFTTRLELSATADYARLARAAGVERVVTLRQVHGSAVCVIRDGSSLPAVPPEADVLVSNAVDVAIAVRAADCVPILMADPATGAVAAVHAGWRGVVAGVIGAAVSSLRVRAAAPPELIAAIGPHISSSAFEVAPEVAREIADACGDASVVDRSRGARPFVDLRRAVRRGLIEAGMSDSAVDDVYGCTVGEPERFFSYRRDGQKSGRHLSAIVPRPA